VKISKLNLFRYRLPLVEQLILKGNKVTLREGFIVEIKNDNNKSGIGEIAPLPGFSNESLEEVLDQIRKGFSFFKDAEIDTSTDDFQAVFEMLPRQLSYPSVRFGIESAVLQLIAQNKNLPVCRMLSKTSRDVVLINGLLSGSPDQIQNKITKLNEKGYTAFKLKVGHGKVEQDAELVFKVREQIGEKALLRLDANRAWDKKQAFEFAGKVLPCRIDYIEEPVKTSSMFKQLLKSDDWQLPLAIDESLSEIDEYELKKFKGVETLVLKPTLLGLGKSLGFIREAKKIGCTVVPSSSFETGVGLTMLGHLSAAFGTPGYPAGLNTLEWFEHDLLAEPFNVEKGRINVNKLPSVPHIKTELLNEVEIGGDDF